MNRFLTRLGLPALAILAGTVPALAQARPSAGPFDFNVKFHAGATAGNLKDDLHAQNMLGLGVEGSYALTSTSAIFGEFTFSAYGGGKGYDNTKLSGLIYGTGGATQDTSVPPNPYLLQIASSVDYRKNTLRGFSLRAGYRGTITGLWSWHSGLTLDGMQFRQEAHGTLQARVRVGTTGSTYTNAGSLEGFALTPTKTKLTPGAFAGVKLQFSENFSLETNLLSVGYGTANYQPYTYTGVAPAVESQTRHGILLEVAFGLKM
jgi:hypothetical protein